MEKVQPVITRTETPAPRREPVAVIGFVCGLAAFLGSIATIVRDLVWLQGCDANPPYFPAYPALAFGVLGVGLGIVGTKRARSRSLVQRKVGTTGAALAAAGIVTVGVVLGAVVGLVAGGIAGAEGWVSGRFVLVIGSVVGSGIGRPSSRIPSRCNGTASAISFLTSASDLPTATQPGKSGT